MATDAERLALKGTALGTASLKDYIQTASTTAVNDAGSVIALTSEGKIDISLLKDGTINTDKLKVAGDKQSGKVFTWGSDKSIQLVDASTVGGGGQGTPLTTNSVGTDHLQDGAVTTLKIADDNVDTTKFKFSGTETVGYYLTLGTNNSIALVAPPVIPANNRLIPSGGSGGQVLKKVSATDYSVEWADDNNTVPTVTSLGLGGAFTDVAISGQVVTFTQKDGTTDKTITIPTQTLPTVSSLGLNDSFINATISGQVITFTQKDGTTVPITIPSQPTTTNTTVWKGNYSSTVTYSLGDVVQRSGIIWLSAANNNTGNIPSDTSIAWYRLSGIKDSSVSTVKIVDNSVTLDKLVHGTAGKVIGFDSNGVPVEITLPTSGVSNLPELGDITITGLGNKQFLQYNNNDSVWKNADLVVGETDLLNDAVTEDKIKDESVTSEKVKTGSLESNDLVFGLLPVKLYNTDTTVTDSGYHSIGCYGAPFGDTVYWQDKLEVFEFLYRDKLLNWKSFKISIDKIPLLSQSEAIQQGVQFSLLKEDGDKLLLESGDDFLLEPVQSRNIIVNHGIKLNNDFLALFNYHSSGKRRGLFITSIDQDIILDCIIGYKYFAPVSGQLT